jgi:hypothetical protein
MKTSIKNTVELAAPSMAMTRAILDNQPLAKIESKGRIQV